MSNPSTNILNCFGGQASACLGGSMGAGFGWQDVDVWKFGVQYAPSPAWVLRAGYNRSDNPIASRDVTLPASSADGTVSTAPDFSRFMFSPAKACGLPRNSETSIWSSEMPGCSVRCAMRLSESPDLTRT